MKRLWMVMLLLTLAACGNLSLEPVNSGGSTGTGSGSSGGSSSSGGETARVVNVIDGDTIDVELNGERVRVRYVGVNTPERDEACYQEAVDANRALVAGQTVRLVRDTSDTDRFDRLLRYIYVGDTLVNAELVKQGVAEAVLYRPDERFYNDFVDYERQAARAGRGCHPTGIFNDGSSTR